MSVFFDYLEKASKHRTMTGAENIIDDGNVPEGETKKSLLKKFKNQVTGLEKAVGSGKSSVTNPYAIAYANLKKKVK